MSHYFFIKQSINKLFMSYAFHNIFIDSFCIIFATATKEYSFDFHPTNRLTIFPLNSSFNLQIHFFNKIKKL